VPEDVVAIEMPLRARVRDGFPRERRPRSVPFRVRPHLPSRPRLTKLRRPPLSVLGGVASVLVAIAVVALLSVGNGDGPASTQGGGSGAPNAPAGSADKLTTGESPAASRPKALESPVAPDISPTPTPGPSGFAPGERQRRIERAASLTLAAPADRLDRVADGITRLTERYEGFVLRSSLSTGDEGTTGGDFELRIPADRLQAAIADLARLADVRARTQNGQDVTPRFVSAQEHLQGARAERRSLLRRLERAPNDAAAESIRRRLDLNAGEIRGLRGQLRDLRTRTNYAKVTLTLQAKDGSGGTSSPGPGDGLGGALDDALRSLSDSIEIAIRVLGVMLPLALLTGGLVLGARTLRRRRREAALG